jgi:hypothetical protein
METTASTGIRLKAALFGLVGQKLTSSDFTPNEANDSFVRRHNGVVDIFQLVCKDAKPGWRIQPNVAVRIELVEQIFHQTSGFDAQDRKNTPTMGGSVGHFLSGSSRAYEFLLTSDSDVLPVTEQIVRTFQEFALPYFERWGSLHAVDAELNDRPSERTQHRSLAWFRCSTGIIVAKLVGRTDYKRLAAYYSDVMARDNKGFYLKRFQSLLKSLETIEPGSGLSKPL